MMWVWAVVLIALIVGGVLVARWVWRSSGSDQEPSPRSGRPALDVLEERYARGNIDRDEFERRRNVLFSETGREKA